MSSPHSKYLKSIVGAFLAIGAFLLLSGKVSAAVSNPYCVIPATGYQYPIGTCVRGNGVDLQCLESTSQTGGQFLTPTINACADYWTIYNSNPPPANKQNKVASCLGTGADKNSPNNKSLQYECCSLKDSNGICQAVGSASAPAAAPAAAVAPDAKAAAPLSTTGASDTTQAGQTGTAAAPAAAAQTAASTHFTTGTDEPPTANCSVPNFMSTAGTTALSADIKEFGTTVNLIFTHPGDITHNGTINTTVKVYMGNMKDGSTRSTSLCNVKEIILPNKMGTLSFNPTNANFFDFESIKNLLSFILTQDGVIDPNGIFTHSYPGVSLVYTDNEVRNITIKIDFQRTETLTGITGPNEVLGYLTDLSIKSPYTDGVTLVPDMKNKMEVTDTITSILKKFPMDQNAYDIAGELPYKLNDTVIKASAKFHLDLYTGAPKSVSDIKEIIIGDDPDNTKNMIISFEALKLKQPASNRYTTPLNSLFFFDGGTYMLEKLNKYSLDKNNNEITIPFTVTFETDPLVPLFVDTSTINKERKGTLFVTLTVPKNEEIVDTALDPFKNMKSISYIVKSGDKEQNVSQYSYSIPLKNGVYDVINDTYSSTFEPSSLGMSKSSISLLNTGTFDTIIRQNGETGQNAEVTFDSGTAGTKTFKIHFVFDKKAAATAANPVLPIQTFIPFFQSSGTSGGNTVTTGTTGDGSAIKTPPATATSVAKAPAEEKIKVKLACIKFNGQDLKTECAQARIDNMTLPGDVLKEDDTLAEKIRKNAVAAGKQTILAYKCANQALNIMGIISGKFISDGVVKDFTLDYTSNPADLNGVNDKGDNINYVSTDSTKQAVKNMTYFGVKIGTQLTNLVGLDGKSVEVEVPKDYSGVTAYFNFSDQTWSFYNIKITDAAVLCPSDAKLY